MKEKPPIVHPGLKFRREKNNTTYIVKKVNGNKILLVSQDGTASMNIQLDSLELAGLKPIYD